MIFKTYSNLEGQHAFLGASKYHWVNYSDEKIQESYLRSLAAERGVRLHQFAHDAIELGIRLPQNRETLNMFVNDAIGYRMATEQVLFYSCNCYGTCDAISFHKNLLRIHDYKSGVSSTSMKQLEIYAALFCLDYGIDPSTIKMELRIYQNNEKHIHEPVSDDIQYIMDKIITANRNIEKLQIEV